VLIGPGCLGLGLIAPITHACGFEIHLVGRPGGTGVPEFEYTLLGGEDESPRLLRAHAFHCPPRAVVPYELRAALSDADVVLITTTVRQDVVDRVEFVHALVDACASGSEVVFVACENRLTQGHKDLHEQLPARGVHCLTTVVDRVCRERERFAPDKPRRVICHTHGEWVIESAHHAPAFTRVVSRAPEVSFESKERVSAEHARKRLLMNGTHFAVGLLAHEAGEVSMEVAANDPRVLRFAALLLGEFYEVLKPDYDDEETQLRGLRALQVTCTFKDDVPRVMSRFRRGSLDGFFEVFEELIASPARRRATGATAPEPFPTLARALVAIIVRGDSYADADDLERGRVKLTDEADRSTVAAFRTACTGWMPKSWIDAHAGRVARALRSQRARWSAS
jgi:hypothetical protein